MPLAHDAVLLLAYGGPTRASQVRPYLDNVLRGRPVPKERYEEVVRHYEAVGGSSPINRLTFHQADGLKRLLEGEGPALPVFVGMRFWDPTITDTLAAIAKEGRRRAVAVVLAPHRSQASWDAYLKAVDEARQGLGERAPAVDYVDPWSDHPRFIEALGARLAETLGAVPADRRRDAAVVFTAHSIPVEMAQASGYPAALHRTAALVGERLGLESGWSLAYQSRSGSPRDPWLEPDIGDALRDLRRRGARDAVVAPIGFVSDHVEVLYDLDVAARAVAREIGLGFFRAGTVGNHPAFLRMIAGLVRDAIARDGRPGRPGA